MPARALMLVMQSGFVQSPSGEHASAPAGAGAWADAAANASRTPTTTPNRFMHLHLYGGFGEPARGRSSSARDWRRPVAGTSAPRGYVDERGHTAEPSCPTAG